MAPPARFPVWRAGLSLAAKSAARRSEILQASAMTALFPQVPGTLDHPFESADLSRFEQQREYPGGRRTQA
jgi:hypothetical protein